MYLDLQKHWDWIYEVLDAYTGGRRTKLELEAIDPPVLQALVRDNIEALLPAGTMAEIEMVEEAEKQSVADFAYAWEG